MCKGASSMYIFPLFFLFALFCCLPGAARAADLGVSFHTPEGEVAHLSQIVVRFSEAMRPLGAMEQPAQSSPLELATDGGSVPAGEFRWLGPDTLAYLFNKPVDAPIRIKARVPAGATALSGARLTLPQQWEVSTKALLVAPREEQTPIGPVQSTIVLRSNYPLNPQSLLEKTRLAVDSGPALPLSLVRDESTPAPYPLPRAVVDGKSGYAPSGNEIWEYTLKVDGRPLASLAPGRNLRLTVDAGVELSGGTASGQAFSYALKGYERLAVLSLADDRDQPGENDEIRGIRVKDPESPVRVLFNNPVRAAELARHLQLGPDAKLVSPSLADGDMGDIGDDAGSRLWYFGYELRPRTEYAITVLSGLKDAYGTELASPVEAKFQTGDYRTDFSMAEGYSILPLSGRGIFPVEFRNAGEVTFRIRYFAWDAKGLQVYAAYTPFSRDTIKSKPTREATISFDSMQERNSLLQRDLDLPRLLDLPDAASLRGIVVIDASYGRQSRDASGAIRETSSSARAVVQCSRFGLSLKLGKENGLAWVTDLDSGRPLSRTGLTIRDESGRILWNGKSDGRGMADLPGKSGLPGDSLFLIASDDHSTSVLYADRDRMDAQSPMVGGRHGQHWQIHALSQSPLYKPGEQVRFTLFARSYKEDDSRKKAATGPWLPLAKTRLGIEVRDPRGKIVFSQKSATNAYGSLSGSFTLAEDATLGRYSVEAKSDGLRPAYHFSPFQVAEFRAPEFAVDLLAPPSQAIAPPSSERETGDAAPPLQAALRAGYFSGAALAGAEAQLAIESRPSRFSPERLAGFAVGMQGDKSMALPSPNPAKLDAEGKTVFTLPEAEVLPGKPRELLLEATVTDPSGLTSQGTANFLLHPSTAYVGLRAPRFATAATPVSIALRAAGHDNRRLGPVEATLTAVRKTWTRNAKGTYEERRETMWEKTVPLTDPDGGRVETTFTVSGSYELIARITDNQGRANQSSLDVLVPGEIMPLDFGRNNTLELIPDEEAYTPGSTARIFVSHPFEKALALVTTERASILSHRLVPLEGPAPILEIPVNDADAPYIYVSILAIGSLPAQAGGADVAGPDSKETATPAMPKFLKATALLRVEKPMPGLSVRVESDAAAYKPGDTVKVSVQAGELPPGQSGQPRQLGQAAADAQKLSPRKAQITLLAVDERVLRAAGESNGYDPSSSFQELFPGGVLTEDSRQWSERFSYIARMRVRGQSGQLLMGKNADALAAPAFMAAGSPEGSGESALRENFDPLVFWLAEAETDSQGRLAASFTLPDSLTGYRLVAVATDASGRFATGESGFSVSKDLQLVSSLPRFLTEGDSLEARILVQNLTKEKGIATVRASASGLTLAAGERRIELEGGASGFVSFPLRAGQTGQAAITVQGSLDAGGNLAHDAAVFNLPVLPRVALGAVASSGVILEGKKHDLTVRLPKDPDPRSVLTLSLAASPAAGMPVAARQVLEYPWDCLEQRMSRAWVRILRLSEGRLLGMQPQNDDRRVIEETLRAVGKFQKDDGGFSLWTTSGPDMYVTAYTLLVDREAKALGLSLPVEVENQAYAWLSRMLQQAYPEMSLAEGAQDEDSTRDRSGAGMEARNSGQSDKSGGKSACLDNGSPEAQAMALWMLSQKEPSVAARLLPRLLECFRANEPQVNPLAWAGLLLTGQELDRLSGKGGSVLEKSYGTEEILGILNKSLVQTPTQAHYLSRNSGGYWTSLGSNLRDNALILAAFSRIPAGNSLAASTDLPRLEALAFWIGQGIGERENLSTQEGVFGLWGLIGYLKSVNTGSATAVEAVFNGKDRFRADFEGPADPPKVWELPASGLVPDADSLLILESLKGAPYWTARLRYASLASPAQPANAGFVIGRVAEAASASPAVGAAEAAAPARPDTPPSAAAQAPSWKIGDIADVTLTLTVPATRRHVVVFSPFPAGMEPLHASRVDLAERDLDTGGVWNTAEQRDDGLLLYAPVLPPGVYSYTYKLRAAAPGAFVCRPATVEEMYTPEVSGRTNEQLVEIAGTGTEVR